LLERLDAGETLISDGATGTYLQGKGLEPGACPEEFNISNPHVVRGMARDYLDAGADMVLTNSFGGNKFMLGKYGHGDRVTEFNRVAAEHAYSQVKSGQYVIGSIGPTGEFLEPLGDVSESEMYDAFAEQALGLAEGGADAVVIETKTALEEVSLAIKSTKENTDLVVMSTMVFDKGLRGFFTMMGITPDIGLKGMLAAGADVVGTNCGNGIELMLELSVLMRDCTDSHLLVHSNAGIPEIKNGEIVYPETPEFMARGFEKIAALGVGILGGCCGTNPDHIRALRETV
jgi:5-methyltetrahydrofolate--homocysteine methyltransferase